MNRKNLVLFVAISLFAAILALGIAVFLFFYSGTEGTEGGQTNTGGNTGGFGEIPNNTNTGTIGGQDGQTSTTTGGGTSGGTVVQNEEKPLPILRDLSEAPIAGYTIHETPTSTHIRYIERRNGNVYEAFPDKEGKVRLSQLTIPKVYEAWWYGKNKDSVLIRLLDDETGVMESFLANLVKRPTTTQNSSRPTTGGESEYTLSGRFIESGILSVTPLENTKEALAYFTSGNTAGAVYTTNSTNAYGVVPGIEWNMQWVDAESLFLTTKPSALFKGHLFLLDKNGSLKKILGDITGLTTAVSPNKKQILYSESANNDFSLKLYSMASSTTVSLALQTLPEKCIWIPPTYNSVYCAVPTLVYRGAYPDLWYKGQIRFHDTIYRIDTDNLRKTEVANYDIIRRPMDMTQISITKDGSYLTFVNKIDNHLWGLSLKDL